MSVSVILLMNNFFYRQDYVNGSNDMQKVNRLMLKQQAIIDIHDKCLIYQNNSSF